MYCACHFPATLLEACDSTNDFGVSKKTLYSYENKQNNWVKASRGTKNNCVLKEEARTILPTFLHYRVTEFGFHIMRKNCM